jgi:hypothetical protein
MIISTTNDLPKVMRETMPEEALALFLHIFNVEKQAGLSDADSFEIAWLIIKKKFRQVEGTWVAESNEMPEIFTFEMDTEDPKIVMNSETEELVMDAILADNTPNKEGKFFTEEELQDIAGQINTWGSTLPDVDHEKLTSLIKKYGRDTDKIRAELRNEKGIFKSIKAVVEKGKLWIQTALDKRYKNHTDKFKSLSIEALADSEPSGRLRKPIYLGFTFTNNPKLINADIVKVAA